MLFTGAIAVLIRRKNLQEKDIKITFVLLSGGKDKRKKPVEGKESRTVLCCHTMSGRVRATLRPPEQPGCSLLLFTE